MGTAELAGLKGYHGCMSTVCASPGAVGNSVYASHASRHKPEDSA